MEEEVNQGHIDRIHRQWRSAATQDDLRAAATEMCKIPALDWKHYLDELHLARTYSGVPGATIDRRRLEILEEFEDELFTSTAEAIQRASGQTR